MELVWLPVHLVTIECALHGVKSDVTCSVEGLSGAFAIFQMHSAIDVGQPDGDSFAPVIDAGTAESIARESLINAILRRRGRAGKPVPGPTKSVQSLLWPYWVYYHSRRGGRLDVQLLDAATGDRPGQKIKLGLLEAFRAAARNQPAKTEGEDV